LNIVFKKHFISETDYLMKSTSSVFFHCCCSRAICKAKQIHFCL